MKKVFIIISLFFSLIVTPAYAQTIIFIPLDDRPVCMDYTVDMLRKANVEVKLPPRELIASRDNVNSPDKLLAWIEKEGASVDAIITSTDALIYGGLVASRKHHESTATLAARVQRVIDLQDKLGVRVYAYSTIMRTPHATAGGTEPAYYDKYGPSIFQWTALMDKQEVVGLSRKEKAELLALNEMLPKEDMKDWLSRRQKNFIINKILLQATAANKFSFFVLGKDDMGSFSQSHKEGRHLKPLTDVLAPTQFQGFVGADQLGLVLALRAIGDYELKLPFVYTHYAAGKGPETVPTYEDVGIAQTVKGHILASGGIPVNRIDNADLVLVMNTPKDGNTLDAGSPRNVYPANETVQGIVNYTVKQLKDNKKVAIADIEFGNGASNALVTALFKEKIAFSLAGYGGWNTASNSLGYALGEGLLDMSQKDRNKVLMTRYLDEWAYQSNVRRDLYQEVVWAEKIDGTRLGVSKDKLTPLAQDKIEQLMRKYVDKQDWQKFNVKFPWDRMFEIDIKVE